MNCKICSSSMSEPVEALFALPTVASDCRAWEAGRSVQICSGCGVMKRIISPFANFKDIYKDYTFYPEPTGRTAKVLDFVKNKMPVPKRVLDVGCGKGDGLRILQDYFSDSVVFGYEPTINPERPDGKFDLITLFHVFEHVEDLHEMLAYVKSSLTEDGHLLIQVPYAAMWPFDLVIADHIWHFTPVSLMKILDDNGFQHIDGAMKGFGVHYPIKKELTILAKIGKPLPAMPHGDWHEEKNPIEWLLSFKSKLDTVNEPVAVYGTSVSAMWTGNILGDKVVCYIDDDNSRLGEFNGKPVNEPYLCALPVIAPFSDWQLAEIKAKHHGLRILW